MNIRMNVADTQPENMMPSPFVDSVWWQRHKNNPVKYCTLTAQWEQYLKHWTIPVCVRNWRPTTINASCLQQTEQINVLTPGRQLQNRPLNPQNVHFANIQCQPDGCIVLHEHNTVFASKRSAICNRCFPGPTSDLDANGVSTASAVFARLTRWQTYRQTNTPCYSVGNNRRHLRT